MNDNSKDAIWIPGGLADYDLIFQDGKPGQRPTEVRFEAAMHSGVLGEEVLHRTFYGPHAYSEALAMVARIERHAEEALLNQTKEGK